MKKKPANKLKSKRIYQVIMATVAFAMILSMIAMAVHW